MQLFEISISALLFIQISYWIFFAITILSIKKNINASNHPFSISLIICFKNELDNLKKNIPSWLQALNSQDELILADDFSSDQSNKYLKTFNDQRIKIFKVSHDAPGKKRALSEAISKAKHKLILLTDADCSLPPQIVSKYATLLKDKKEIILGYAPFHRKKGFLNIFQRFECLLTAVQYFSFARAGLPYMGVGRNMMFKKQLHTTDIYKDSLSASGDDDLFISSSANAHNIALSLDPATFVYSDAKENLDSYIRQKLRHVSSSFEYKTTHQFILSLFSGSFLLLYFFLFIGLIMSALKFVLLIWIIRISLLMIIFKTCGARFKENDLWAYIPLLDVFLFFYYLVLILFYPFSNKSKWN